MRAPGHSRSQSLCQRVRLAQILLHPLNGVRDRIPASRQEPQTPRQNGGHPPRPGSRPRGQSGELPRCLQGGLGRRVTLCLFPSPAAMKSGGTQLKLVMTFQNYGQALFKPMK